MFKVVEDRMYSSHSELMQSLAKKKKRKKHVEAEIIQDSNYSRRYHLFRRQQLFKEAATIQ